LNSLKDLLDNHYQVEENQDSSESELFNTSKNYQELERLSEQWKKTKKKDTAKE
jgi:hypothetical protein